MEYSSARPPESSPATPPESPADTPPEGSEPLPPTISSPGDAGAASASAPVWEVPPATGTPVWEIPPAGEASGAGAQDAESTDRPEIAAGLAFAGGLVAAVIVRRLAS